MIKKKYKIEGGLLELKMKDKVLTIRRKFIGDKTKSTVVEIPEVEIHKLLCFLEGICYENKDGI